MSPPADRAATPTLPVERDDDELLSLTEGNRRVVRMRERDFLAWAFTQRDGWDPDDITFVLAKVQLLEAVWNSKALWSLKMHFARTLKRDTETDHYGVQFGLYCMLDEKMPTRQLRRLPQAGCHKYDVEHDSYHKTVLLTNPHDSSDVLHVVRMIPPLTVLMPQFQKIVQTLNLTASADGRISFSPTRDLVNSLLDGSQHSLIIPEVFYSIVHAVCRRRRPRKQCRLKYNLRTSFL